MLRVTPRTLLRISPSTTRPFTSSIRSLSESSKNDAGSQNATPGWKGRQGDDHVLHRDGRDAQSAPSTEARKDKAEGKEGSGAISQKDERNANQRAQDDHPEAPMVIGMNSGMLLAFSCLNDDSLIGLQREVGSIELVSLVSMWRRKRGDVYKNRGKGRLMHLNGSACDGLHDNVEFRSII